MILSLITSSLIQPQVNNKKKNDMLDKLKEVSKKVKQAKLKSVKDSITMSEALKEVFKEN